MAQHPFLLPTLHKDTPIKAVIKGMYLIYLDRPHRRDGSFPASEFTTVITQGLVLTPGVVHRRRSLQVEAEEKEEEEEEEEEEIEDD